VSSVFRRDFLGGGANGAGDLADEAPAESPDQQPDRGDGEDRLNGGEPLDGTGRAERDEDELVAHWTADSEEGDQSADHTGLACSIEMISGAPVISGILRGAAIDPGNRDIRRDEQSGEDSGEDRDRPGPPLRLDRATEDRIGDECRGNGERHRGEHRGDAGDPPSACGPHAKGLPGLHTPEGIPGLGWRDTRTKHRPARKHSVTTQPFDEMYDGGLPRVPHAELHRVLEHLGPEELGNRARVRDSYLDRHGITFTLGERERPLPMDLVPRIITATEWSRIEAGVIQRLRALEAFLADVYGPGQVLADGVIPRHLVTSSTHFHRQAWGIIPPNGVRIHVSGIDLIRDEQGEFRVLEDNLRNPSGVSYVLENRRTMGHVLPEVFAGHVVRPVAEYPDRLEHALRLAAPVTDPAIVVLTPGVHNSAHYEHAFLARRMGVELVEGRDLYCRDDRVWMRTTLGPRRVHVIYRRIDDDFLDPVQLRSDSILGVPGLLNAARSGHVTIANAVGNGVADDKAVYPYVPKFIEYYLGEEPLLPNVDTFDLSDPDQRAHVIENVHGMVVKPSDASGGYGLLMGPSATDEQIARTISAMEADPRGWIAQPVVVFSTCPTMQDDGHLSARHVDLRPFAVNDGSEVYVLPGGLTRVALPEGSLVVNSSQGGGSKDTWVLDDSGVRQRPAARPVPRVTIVDADLPARREAPRTHDERMQQQERQQQQTSDGLGSRDGDVSC
jgi:uncharacterized circularly permuted ATP-grasp superfamily protein